MNTPAPSLPRADARGLAGAATAFIIWGLLPLYLKLLGSVPALHVTAHRLIWACLFAMVWLALRDQLGQVRIALANPCA